MPKRPDEPTNPLPAPPGPQPVKLPDWLIKYRYVTIPVVFLVVVVIAAIWVRILQGKTIRAGEVTLTGQNQIRGSFTVTTKQFLLSMGSVAIRSKGTGGACLVADLNRFSIPSIPPTPGWKCSQNSDCQEGLPDKGLPTAWAGYCDVDGGKKCWVRPSPQSSQFCNISHFHPPPPGKIWDGTNEATKDPNHLLPFVHGPYQGKPIDWRVVACLNHEDPDPKEGKPGCAAVDSPMRMEVFGPITTVQCQGQNCKVVRRLLGP